MKVEFSKKFSKDLDNLKLKSVKQTLLRHIEFLEIVETLEEIPNTKKLRGHKTAFRTRIGDYRLGFFLENSLFYLEDLFTEKIFTKYFHNSAIGSWFTWSVRGSRNRISAFV